MQNPIRRNHLLGVRSMWPALIFTLFFGVVLLVCASARHKTLAQKREKQWRPSVIKLPAIQESRSATLLWVFNEKETKDEFAAKIRKELSRNKVKEPGAAVGVALDYKMRHGGGTLAEEGENVVALIRIGRKVDGFADKGDLIWIVWFGTGGAVIPGGITQALWISSTTGKVRAVLPPWPKPS